LSVEIHCLFNCHFIPDKRSPPKTSWFSMQVFFRSTLSKICSVQMFQEFPGLVLEEYLGVVMVTNPAVNGHKLWGFSVVKWRI
jgi:hypothetical protein